MQLLFDDVPCVADTRSIARTVSGCHQHKILDCFIMQGNQAPGYLRSHAHAMQKQILAPVRDVQN